MHDVSRSMGIWQRSTILRFLADERYTGMYIVGKRGVIEVGGSRSKLKPESEWVKIPNHHSPIVSKELFDEVNERLLHFNSPKTTRDFLLRAKVFCGCCNHAMQVIHRKKRAFGCLYTKAVETAECHGLEIGEGELEELLYAVIEKQAQVILNVERLGDAGGFQIQTERQAELSKLIEGCREKKRRLYEQMILGELDAAEYKTAKAEADVELDRLTRALEKLNEETAATQLARTADDELREFAGTALTEGRLTRAIVDLLVDKVYIFQDNRVEIRWKVAGFEESFKMAMA